MWLTVADSSRRLDPPLDRAVLRGVEADAEAVSALAGIAVVVGLVKADEAGLAGEAANAAADGNIIGHANTGLVAGQTASGLPRVGHAGEALVTSRIPGRDGSQATARLVLGLRDTSGDGSDGGDERDESDEGLGVHHLDRFACVDED